MRKPLLLFPYELVWKAARPLLRRHKRLTPYFFERLVPKDWPEGFKPAEASSRTVHPPFRLWIHAASGGEAYLAREIVAQMAPRVKDFSIICTSMTEQGIDVLLKMQKEFCSSSCYIAVNYFPLDEPDLMRRAVEQAFGPPSQAPRMVVLLETEIWPGLLSACRELGVRSYIINARMTQGSYGAYKRIMGTLGRIAPNGIMATSDEDASRFRYIFDERGGPSRVSLMKNIKFDRVRPANVMRPNPIRPLLGKKPPQVALFASVRKEEEKKLMPVISDLRKHMPDTCIIVAPRHMHRVKAWTKRLSALPGFKLRSDGLRSMDEGDVILWDAFGELMDLYDISATTFVGGSLAPLGGQNFLEPLSFGVVPIIGPSWSNFYWAGQDPFEMGIAKQVQDARQLAAVMIEHLKKPRDKNWVRSQFSRYLQKHKGGTGQAVDFLSKCLWFE